MLSCVNDYDWLSLDCFSALRPNIVHRVDVLYRGQS